MVGGVPDVITCAKFQIEIFMGYDFTGGRIFDFRFSYSAVLLYDKRNASICVLSHIAFTLCLFFLCREKYLGDGDTGRCGNLRDGTYRSQTCVLSFCGRFR